MPEPEQQLGERVTLPTYTTDLIVGGVLGKLAGMTVIEPTQHAVFAHRTRVLESEGWGDFARTVLAVMPGERGMNPACNGHRKHHYEGDAPSSGLLGVAKFIIKNGNGHDGLAEEDRAHLQIRGLDPATDPLINFHDDGTMSYRKNLWIERFTAESTPKRLMPIVGVMLGLAAFNKILGRSKPAQRAGAMTAAFAAGMYYRTAQMGYLEATAGMDDNETHFENIKTEYGRKVAKRHAEHHIDPTDALIGMTRLDRLGFRLLERVGFVSKLASKKS